jgi:tetratricopeptide (TPR) repeat protein
MRWFALALFLVGCGGATQAVQPTTPGPTLRAQTQVITPTDGATERELLERGERALMVQRWREAADAFELLLEAKPSDAAMVATATLDLGLAYQGLGEYAKARDALERRLAISDVGPDARIARNRLFAVLAYLEDWPALGAHAEKTLARQAPSGGRPGGETDLGPMDKMNALGARSLSRIEAGDDAGAERDLQSGLDIKEEQRYGNGGRLPGPAAQLEFAQGEIRRTRSEKISFTPVGDDFLAKMNVRCQGLIDAQASYADAMRSDDPFWATISGYRVGQMYRAIHRDLMTIPPTALAKSEKQKQIFFGIMHLRYRVLLEKGMEMMKRTYDFAVKNGDQQWVLRATQGKHEMELSLEEEKAVIASFPFSEQEIQDALKLMEQHYNEAQAKKKK